MAQIQQAQFQAPQKGGGLGKLVSIASLASGASGLGAEKVVDKVAGAGSIASGLGGLSGGSQQAPIQANPVGDQQGAIQRRIDQYQQAPQAVLAEGLQAARGLPGQRRQQVEETLRKAYEASQPPQMA